MYNLYSTKEKIYFSICGLIITLCLVWVTHITFEYRQVRAEWNETFTTPKAYWEIPELNRNR